MRSVIQLVKEASVTVSNEVIGKIGPGLLVFLAVHLEDTEIQIEKMATKIAKLRIFEDETGKMSKSVQDIGGEILVVSQFTLYGDCKKGNRPSFIQSAKPEKAEPYYEKVIQELKNKGINVQTGKFAAMMDVQLINDGPVTILIDV